MKPPDVCKSRSSPNHSSRYGNKIEGIILHHTGPGTVRGILAHLCSPDSDVSAHYVIAQDGRIWQLVQLERAAWHAGESKMGGRGSVNARSVGIEIVNPGDGVTSFTSRQYDAVIEVCRYLVDLYQIEEGNLLGHRDVAPGRKVDPADNFDWALVRRGVFGARR